MRSRIAAGVVGLDEVEIALACAGGADSGSSPCVDAVGGPDDPALPGLAEDLRQPHDRHRLGGDEVGQHRARARPTAADPRRRPAPGRPRPAPPAAAGSSARTSTIDASSTTSRSQSSGWSRSRLKPPSAGVELQQAVDRLAPRGRSFRSSRLAARPVGAHRRAAQLLGREDLEDAADDGRLADAGAAGDDQHLLRGRLADGVALAGGQRPGPSSARPSRRAASTSIAGSGCGPARSVAQRLGDADFGAGTAASGTATAPASRRRSRGPARFSLDQLLRRRRAGSSSVDAGQLGGSLEHARLRESRRALRWLSSCRT